MKNKVIVITTLLIFVVVLSGCGGEKDSTGIPNSAAKIYHDEVFVQNNRLLVKEGDEWVTKEKALWTALSAGIAKGEVIEEETHKIPTGLTILRLIKNQDWDLTCYIDRETGEVYLNRAMEEKADDLFTVIRLDEKEFTIILKYLE